MIGMYSNIYTNIIFIGLLIFIGIGVKITVHTEKYPETLFILPNIRNFFSVTTNYTSSFFPCGTILQIDFW